DFNLIFNNFMEVLKYLTPVVYSTAVASDLILNIIKWNPLTYLIEFPRNLLLGGGFEYWNIYLWISLGSLILLMLAIRFYYLAKPSVIEKMTLEMEMEKELLVEVEQVSKKFCKNLKWSMVHGITDLGKIAIGTDLKRNKLRKEEFWALKDVCLKVYRGDLLCILGNNGSGKTTLMRLIAGIYPVDKGQITVNGKVSSLFAIKSGMPPHFSGRETIYIKGGMFGLTREQINQDIDWIIDFSELGDFIDSPLGTYASGMRSRLGYAIAVGTEPDVLIIDEGLAV